MYQEVVMLTSCKYINIINFLHLYTIPAGYFETKNGNFETIETTLGKF